MPFVSTLTLMARGATNRAGSWTLLFIMLYIARLLRLISRLWRCLIPRTTNIAKLTTATGSEQNRAYRLLIDRIVYDRVDNGVTLEVLYK